MKPTVFAGNWKMHLGPRSAVQFVRSFLQRYRKQSGAEIWFFPPAVSIRVVADLVKDRPEIRIGSQNVFWEDKGAYTGETSVPMAVEAGCAAALVGHSERRHVFGETIAETHKKVKALLTDDLTPFLCVGETLDEREDGATREVVEAQLGALDGLDSETLEGLIIAYEPVWAIGTGKTATPEDAAEVHSWIRDWVGQRGADGSRMRILYGGSVKPDNARELLSQDEINGVLVGGASLDPDAWWQIVQCGPD